MQHTVLLPELPPSLRQRGRSIVCLRLPSTDSKCQLQANTEDPVALKANSTWFPVDCLSYTTSSCTHIKCSPFYHCCKTHFSFLSCTSSLWNPAPPPLLRRHDCCSLHNVKPWTKLFCLVSPLVAPLSPTPLTLAYHRLSATTATRPNIAPYPTSVPSQPLAPSIPLPAA